MATTSGMKRGVQPKDAVMLCSVREACAYKPGASSCTHLLCVLACLSRYSSCLGHLLVCRLLYLQAYHFKDLSEDFAGLAAHDRQTLCKEPAKVLCACGGVLTCLLSSPAA